MSKRPCVGKWQDKCWYTSNRKGFYITLENSSSFLLPLVFSSEIPQLQICLEFFLIALHSHSERHSVEHFASIAHSPTTLDAFLNTFSCNSNVKVQLCPNDPVIYWVVFGTDMDSTRSPNDLYCSRTHLLRLLLYKSLCKIMQQGVITFQTNV